MYFLRLTDVNKGIFSRISVFVLLFFLNVLNFFGVLPVSPFDYDAP